jgi:hypothetical protein
MAACMCISQLSCVAKTNIESIANPMLLYCSWRLSQTLGSPAVPAASVFVLSYQ